MWGSIALGRKENQSTVNLDIDRDPFFGNSQGSQNNDLEISSILRREMWSYWCSRYERGTWFQDEMLFLMQEQEKVPDIVKLPRGSLCISRMQIELNVHFQWQLLSRTTEGLVWEYIFCTTLCRYITTVLRTRPHKHSSERCLRVSGRRSYWIDWIRGINWTILVFEQCWDYYGPQKKRFRDNGTKTVYILRYLWHQMNNWGSWIESSS